MTTTATPAPTTTTTPTTSTTVRSATTTPTPPAGPPSAPNAPGSHFTMPGASWLSLDVEGTAGTLTVGGASVAVVVQPAADGSPTTVDADLSGVTLGAVSASAIAAGATDPAAALPPALSQVLSSVAISTVAVSLDLDAQRLVGVDLVVDAVPSWPLC